MLSKAEINKWRTIVQTLINYGLYDLLEDEIATVAKCLAREGGDKLSKADEINKCKYENCECNHTLCLCKTCYIYKNRRRR